MIQIDNDMPFDVWPTDSKTENILQGNSEVVKVGDYVHCAGEGDEVFKVEQIKKDRALMHKGWWESISKLTVLDPKKVSYYTQTIYIYDEN